MSTVAPLHAHKETGCFLVKPDPGLRTVPQDEAQRQLFEHVSECLDCLFVISRQRESLVEAGCSRFQELFEAAHPLFDCSESPLGSVHLTEEIIENYDFRRLSALENRVLETHVNLCSECEVKLHDYRLFLYALKAALEEDPSFYRKRSGATFAKAVGA